MNLPGFIPEASITFDIRNYSNQKRYNIGESTITMQKLRYSGPSRRGSLSLNSFECSGTCPDGKILCKSDINCVCCSEGCVDIIGGGGVKCGTIS